MIKQADLKAVRGNRAAVISLLQNTAKSEQARILSFLTTKRDIGEVEEFRSYYIFNGLYVKGTKQVVLEVSNFPEVKIIYEDEIIYVGSSSSVTSPNSSEASLLSSSSGYWWNIEKIGAKKVREELGVDGSDVLVGIIDEGFSGNHPDLLPRWKSQYGWRDFVNGQPNPYDSNNGHGTRVTGIVVAGNNSSDNIGVAPGAQFISAKAFHDGSGSTNNILDAMEWMLDPDGDQDPNTGAEHVPDVVNNSWGGSTYNDDFWDAVNSWISAGIFPCFIAQNWGPNPSTVSAPGSYPQSFCVGAVDSNDVVPDFSGRGPVTWSGVTYIKPDVVAPHGPAIKFCIPTDQPWWQQNYPSGYIVESGATSTSGPHVTGAVALIKSAHPEWDIDPIKLALEATALDLDPPGKDNDSGSGRIDVYKSITSCGTLPADVNWLGKQTLTCDVIVPDGRTLTIASGATINLNGNYIKCLGSGKIVRGSNVAFTPKDISVKSGSTLKGQYSTIQQAINNASSGQNVYLASDTYNETINMKSNVDIVGAGESSTTIDGTVTFNNDDNASLALMTVKKKISITNSDFVTLSLKTTGSGYIEASGSVIDVDDITSHTSYSKAVYAHTYSDLEVWAGTIKNKSAVAVPVYYYSSGLIEEVDFCQNNIDISADPPGTDTYYCTFSSSQEGGSVSGDVSWEEWDWCGFSKQLAKSVHSKSGQEIIVTNGDDRGLKDYREALGIWRTIRSNLRQDKKSDRAFNPQNYASEFASAAAKFKQVIANYPDGPYTTSALGQLAVIWRVSKEFQTLENYMLGIASNPKLAHLHSQALGAMIPALIKQQAYAKAIELSDQIIQEFPQDAYVCELLYGKGIIYKYYLNDLNKAEEMFKLVIAQYPEHLTAESSREELEETGKEYFTKESAEPEPVTELSAQNYPNPFNPETRIQFTLPEPGRVFLTIYDILGREVTTLMDADRLSGKYSVNWDGKNSEGLAVASGIYFYQIRFRGDILTNKMLLIR